MRTRIGTIHIVALDALAVGAAAGWFAAGAWGERKCGNVELWNCGNVETANVGRARSPACNNGRAGSPLPADSNPRRKARLRTSADSEVQKRILQNRLKSLEQRLETVKKDAEAVAAARAARGGKDGEMSGAGHVLQMKAALKELGLEDVSKATVGDIRRLAPDWWAWQSKWTSTKCDRIRRQTLDIMNLLSSADTSGMTTEELQVFEDYAHSMADLALDIDARFDAALADDAEVSEMQYLINNAFGKANKNGYAKKFKAASKLLENWTARELGLTGEQAAEFLKIRDVAQTMTQYSVGRADDKSMTTDMLKTPAKDAPKSEGGK